MCFVGNVIKVNFLGEMFVYEEFGLNNSPV